MNQIKKSAFIAAAMFAFGANIAGAATYSNGAIAQRDVYTDGGRMTRDAYTDGLRSTGARDPYIDGGKAGKFEIYSDGAWTGDTRYPSTDGAAK